MTVLSVSDLDWPFWLILGFLFAIMAIPSVILPVWAHFSRRNKWPDDGE